MCTIAVNNFIILNWEKYTIRSSHTHTLLEICIHSSLSHRLLQFIHLFIEKTSISLSLSIYHALVFHFTMCDSDSACALHCVFLDAITLYRLLFILIFFLHFKIQLLFNQRNKKNLKRTNNNNNSHKLMN